MICGASAPLFLSILSTINMAKPYFPNNWEEIKDAPDELFQRHTFEEMMEWRVQSWEFPSSVYCVIREENLKTGKIKEHTYQRRSAAAAKIEKLLEAADVEFTVADHDSIHFLSPKLYDESDND